MPYNWLPFGNDTQGASQPVTLVNNSPLGKPSHEGLLNTRIQIKQDGPNAAFHEKRMAGLFNAIMARYDVLNPLVPEFGGASGSSTIYKLTKTGSLVTAYNGTAVTHYFKNYAALYNATGRDISNLLNSIENDILGAANVGFTIMFTIVRGCTGLDSSGVTHDLTIPSSITSGTYLEPLNLRLEAQLLMLRDHDNVVASSETAGAALVHIWSMSFAPIMCHLQKITNSTTPLQTWYWSAKPNEALTPGIGGGARATHNSAGSSSVGKDGSPAIVVRTHMIESFYMGSYIAAPALTQAVEGLYAQDVAVRANGVGCSLHINRTNFQTGAGDDIATLRLKLSVFDDLADTDVIIAQVIRTNDV